ncbi:MAG: GNAT family N-acetyltransferase [Myxococcota bacterium]
MSPTTPHTPPTPHTPIILEVLPDDPLYLGERRLRWTILRAPLGMPVGSEENAREPECRHFVTLDAEGSVVGCVLWLPERPDERSGRLLQMAVAHDRQGQGLGRALVRGLEAAVHASGFDEVTLHARDTAIGFYERLGYESYGEPFVEVGIPHRHMRRKLGPARA